MRSLLGVLTALMLAGATPTVATGAPLDAATPRITSHGVGKIKLGARFKQLHAKGLVGELDAGCESSGPTRTAALEPPLQGSVTFKARKPYKVSRITITGGAAARGVGIGDSLADITAAYSKVRIDRSREQDLGTTIVSIPKKRLLARIVFLIPIESERISSIGVPLAQICE